MGAYRERRAQGKPARAGMSLSEVPAWGTTPILVGDHIENAGNADCLRAAAAMFDWPCGCIGDSVEPDGTWRLSGDALARSGVPIIAVENAGGAEDLFKYRPPEGPYAVVVGNERKGVSRELLRLADRVIQIPIQSVQLNCLNVAAAASVALYRLARQGRQIATRGGRSGSRPVVVLAGIDDAIELGSVLRLERSLRRRSPRRLVRHRSRGAIARSRRRASRTQSDPGASVPHHRRIRRGLRDRHGRG